MQDIASTVHKIQQGNERLREELISSCRENIRQYASFICKRQLNWENDDELSISLIAFNKAIDTFDNEKGRNFLAYARLLIKNSLIDYFRSQHRKASSALVALNGKEDSVPSLEEIASQKEFQLELERRERAYEIHRFKEILRNFSLTLDDLVRSSPSHGDTRDKLNEVALMVRDNAQLVERIYREKKLPLKEIQLLSGIKSKNLERWRRYLLSLIIILTSEELEEMKEYIKKEEAPPSK